jgi:hypothetical protein
MIEKKENVERAFARIADRMNRIYDGDLPRVEFDRVTDGHMSGRVVWDEAKTKSNHQTTTSP